MYLLTKRLIDILLSGLGMVILCPLLLFIAIWIKIESKGPILHRSQRIGRYNRSFKMLKFRTMTIDAPVVAADCLKDAHRYLTRCGVLLRSTSLDELPQLFHVLSGSMSLVGPRPALFNQEYLIRERTARGIHRLTPGITGFAQVNGRGLLTSAEKVHFDQYYVEHQTLGLDFRILLRTVYVVVQRKDVTPCEM